MEQKVSSHETKVGSLDTGKSDEEKGFWYDVSAVSGSHAAVTVSIAGLSLALLLVLPVFSADKNWKPEMGITILFFFISMVFGLLASFEYSVLSGDKRSEMNRVITFIGPSVAFGIAVPTLFLGFLYAVDMYFQGQDRGFVMAVMRWFTLFALWTAGVLVVRTVVEALQILKGTWRRTAWYKGKIVLIIMFVYGVFGVLSVTKHYSQNTPILQVILEKLPISLEEPTSSEKFKYYFYFMIALAFMSIFHYALFSYMGIERKKMGSGDEQKENGISKYINWLGSPASVKFFTIFLSFTFFVFVIWTFLVFV